MWFLVQIFWNLPLPKYGIYHFMYIEERRRIHIFKRDWPNKNCLNELGLELQKKSDGRYFHLPLILVLFLFNPTISELFGAISEVRGKKGEA